MVQKCILTLKEIDAEESKIKPVLKVTPIKSIKWGSLPKTPTVQNKFLKTPTVQNKFSLAFSITTGCGSILNFSQSCKEMGTENFTFSYNCDSVWRSSHSNWCQNVPVHWCLSSLQVWKKPASHCQNASQHKLFCLFFFLWNHLIKVPPPPLIINQLRLNKYDVHLTNKFDSITNSIQINRTLSDNLLSCALVALNQV